MIVATENVLTELIGTLLYVVIFVGTVLVAWLRGRKK